jgi:excinuclease UvrABC nuclease subunit
MLDHCIRFDPGEPLEELLARVPAAWCVYLLADAQSRPLQLLCVRNLRASLRRRLAAEMPSESGGPSRRIDYRALVRQISWTRVDSAFEQDVIYLETARRAFPQSYAGVLGFQPAWWIHVDPSAQRPRFTRTTEPGTAPGRCFGPIPDKNAAQKLLHTIEDLFDLCRDPAVLAAAPAGPCQWRQMHKCVGPCDGSVSLAAYRGLVDHAADVMADVGRAVEEHTLRMRQAAAALDFERAGRIKEFLDRLSTLREGPLKHLRPLERFRFVAVMPGRGRETAKLFTVTPEQTAPLACLLGSPKAGRGEQVLRLALEALAADQANGFKTGAHQSSREQREGLSLVTHHLFPSRRTPGVFIPLESLEDRALASAFREVSRQRAHRDDEEGEIRAIEAI